MPLGQISNPPPSASAGVVVLLFGVVFAITAIVWRRGRRLYDPRPNAPRLTRLLARLESVEFGGKCYRLSPLDYQVRDWLCDWMRRDEGSGTSAEQPLRLVAYRGVFRQIVAIRPIGGLVLCLLDSDTRLRMLAVWLLGRCRDKTSLAALRVLQRNRDPEIRRQLVKAYSRIGAWHELRWMAVNDQDPRVRIAALSLSDVGRRSYRDRLQRYVQHGGGKLLQSGTFHSSMALRLPQPVVPGKPIKTRDCIRRILEHIRQLVNRALTDRAA